MLRLHLSSSDRRDLQWLRGRDVRSVIRSRIEMLFLSDGGMSVPQIASHLGCHAHTVRKTLKAFSVYGLSSLFPKKPGPAPDLIRYQSIVSKLTTLLGQDRTWTSAQLAEALAKEEIVLSPRQVRRYLKHMGARYLRTASTLKHKQNPEKVQQAKTVLSHLQSKARKGRLRLFYLDESGFSPSLPLGHSWSLWCQRKRVPYEYPRDRRVNALADYEPFGNVRKLRAQVFGRTLTWEDLLRYLRRLPPSRVPRVVVMDNASIHTCKAFKAHRHKLTQQGIYLDYLPGYSPELNKIEAIFKQLKHHHMSKPSYKTKNELHEAVTLGFKEFAKKIKTKSYNKLRPCA